MSKINNTTKLNNKNVFNYKQNIIEVKERRRHKSEIIKRNSNVNIFTKTDRKFEATTGKNLNKILSDKKTYFTEEKNCKNSNKKSKFQKWTKKNINKGIFPNCWVCLNYTQSTESCQTYSNVSKTKKKERNTLTTKLEKNKKEWYKVIRKSKSVPLSTTFHHKYEQNQHEYYIKFENNRLIENDLDKFFIENLQKLNKKEYFIQCNCIGTDSSWKAASIKSKNLWQNAKNIFRIFFIPETERNFTHKAIFWPQKSNYFFYQIKNYEHESFDVQHFHFMQKYKALTQNNAALNEITKMKLQKIYSNVITHITDNDEPKGEFLFGHNHPCYAFTGNVKFFFIKDNKNGDTIPCAYTVTGKQTKYTLIYSHPNAYCLEDLIIGFPSLCDIARFLNVEIIAYEYPGYGICSGKPTERRLFNRLMTVYNFLINKQNILPSEIILLGYSLGGALSTMAAANNKNIGGLILFATPASFKSCVIYKLFYTDSVNDSKINTDDPFDVIEHIKMVKCPTLVVHSKTDKVVPFSHMAVLLKYLRKKAEHLVLKDVSHNAIERNIEVWIRVKKFLIEDLPRKK